MNRYFSLSKLLLIISLSIWSGVAQSTPENPDYAPLLSTLQKAQGFPTRDLRIAPDGETLAVGIDKTGGRIGGWVLLDAHDGSFREMQELRGKELGSLAFSADGQWLALENRVSDKLEVWNLKRHTLQWSVSWIGGLLRFSPNSRVIVGSDYTRDAQIWDTLTGSEIKTLPATSGGNFAFSPDSRWFAVANRRYIGDRSQPAITIWDARTWTSHRALTSVLGEPIALTFSPDSKTFAVGSGDDRNFGDPSETKERLNPYRAQIWDVASGQMIREFIHVAPVRDLAFAPDGKTLLGVAGSVRRWDVASGNLLEFLPQRGVTKLALAPDGSVFLGYHSGEVRRWNGQGFRPLVPPSAVPVRWLASDSDVFAFTPDGKQLIGVNTSYTRDGIKVGDALLGVWNVAGALQRVALAESDEKEGNKACAPLFTLPTPWTVSDIAVSEDGRWLAAGSEQGDRDTPKSGAIKVWKRKGVTIVEPATAKIDISGTSVMRVGFRPVKRPDGEALAVAVWCSDFTVRLFDPRNGQNWGTLPRGAIVRYFSPGNRAVHDPIILPQSYQQKKFRVEQSVFSSRANLIAAGVSNYQERKTLLLRPFAPGENFPHVVAEISGAWGATFSPDGRWLVVGSSEGAQLWNVATRRLERILKNGTNIEFSLDGNTLAVGSRSYGVTLYDLPQLNLGPKGLRAIGKAEAEKFKARFPDPNSEKRWFEQHPAIGELARTPETNNVYVIQKTVSADRKTVAVAWNAGFTNPDRKGILVRAVAGDGDSFTDKFDFDVPWGEVSQLALSRDGSILAAAQVMWEDDVKVGQLVQVWNLKSGQLLQTFRMPGASEFSVDVSPDGRLVAATNVTTESAQQERYQIRIWDIARGQLVRFVPDADYAGNLEFSDDGRALNSYGNNGSIWSLD